MDYEDFLEGKRQIGGSYGFDPVWMPDFLFPFQADLVEWAIRKGRAALFADCGLGKTPMQLVWADNVARHTGRPVLVATPLAVSYQTGKEAEKFGIDAARSQDGTINSRIVVTNYERLGEFDPKDFAGMVCDESSILKNFNGKRKAAITEFMRRLPFRLLCTATAAPNDYVELGTSSEALGELGHMDMLGMFFKNDQNTSKPAMYLHRGTDFEAAYARAKWRLKGHARKDFWRWVCSWARACRSPSDLGYDDGRFVLPDLVVRNHVVDVTTTRDGWLIDLPAQNLQEEREERRRTIGERCAKVADLVNDGEQALVWCHLNDESATLARSIDGSEEVRGSHSDEQKEARLLAFQRGELRVLVTKPRIGAWGLNLQGCHHVTFFPSHSYEQYYQGVRRCWRFGQDQPVTVDIVSTEGEENIARNLSRKSDQADSMFTELVSHMRDSLNIKPAPYGNREMEAPSWL